jgi:glycolate oxidase FAD binding subunit
MRVASAAGAPGAATAAADPALARLVEQVHDARARKTALEIRGGLSKAFYGEAPRGEPLEVAPLAGISSYEPSELVVTVRAGTRLAELEATLAERGQWLPFEPPRFALNSGVGAAAMPHPGTVGGMVAAGLAGPGRAAYGGVRDYVLGATMLDGRGEVLTFGGQVMKNVAGYDVARLLSGSMGVLGVICEVSLKVLPLPVARATLRLELDQAAALSQLDALSGQPLPIGASAWWDGTLVLRLAGAAAAVQAAHAKIGGEVIDPALADTFWAGLRDQTDEFFAHAMRAVDRGESLWRVSLPQVAPPLALAGQQLIEWGGALRWFVTDASADAVRGAAQAAGGHATLFRPRPGHRRDVFAPLAPPLQRIHRELKAAFDPDRIFNPGRLYPDL